jgi:hypothetical protein
MGGGIPNPMGGGKGSEQGGGPMGMAKSGMTPPPMQLMQGKMPLPPGVNLILGAKGQEQPSATAPLGAAKGGGKGGEKKQSSGGGNA